MENEKYNFTRVKKGYDPDEVYKALLEYENNIRILSEKNKNLEDEVDRLNRTLIECRDRIQKLSEKMDRLEEERVHESLRLAKVLTTAEKTANETIARAKNTADQLLGNANRNAEQVEQKTKQNYEKSKEEMTKLVQAVKSTRENINKYFDKMDTMLLEVTDSIKLKNIPGMEKDPDYGDSDRDEDKYAKFLREHGLSKSEYIPPGEMPPFGNIIKSYENEAETL